MGFVQNSSGRLDGWGLCKTQVEDLTDGVVLIPFIECLWNDTCLPNCRFSTNQPIQRMSMTH
jgi:hypothetical protein